MGNQKQKWTQDEEDALIAGVEKHGPGKWKNILKDPQFAPFLTSRSNIDLKDKWRNLSVSNGSQGSKDKSRVPKLKALPAPSATSATLQAAAPTSQNVPSDAAAIPVADPSQNELDSKNPPRYNAMVFEALTTLKDSNGSDLNAIVSFIEQKHQVPQNFRRALSTRLRRLVSQGKLEKVQNCYKIKKDSSVGPKSPAPKPKDVRPPQQQSPASVLMASKESIKEAADTAAYRVADAESKSYLAAEAVREAEKISLLVEDCDSMLQLAKDIYEQCSGGQVILLV
ncbi:hypothetical protein Fmac_012374 [Flemingia macrophylla]|uniref:MYB transcription factor n=1 Tax=Flemingia macrophylla TaxID=520843 RepID=A0ABD1MQ59_9FABA